MWKTEWDYWTSEETLAQVPKERAKFVRENLFPLQDRFDLIEQGAIITKCELFRYFDRLVG